MKDVLFYSLVTFFSVYGIFSFFFFIADFFLDNKYLKEKTIYTIFSVKNEVCRIENIVRSMLFKIYKNDIGMSDQKIIIVDLGSDDGTYQILKKLQKDEKLVLVYKREEIAEILEKL